MQRTVTAQTHPRELYFRLIQEKGHIEQLWCPDNWQTFLSQQFTKAKIKTYGFNNHSCTRGFHVVKMKFTREDVNEEVIESYRSAFLSCAHMRPHPHLPESIDSLFTREFPDSHSVFDSQNILYESFSFSQVYGEEKILANYLASIPSQRVFQTALEPKNNLEKHYIKDKCSIFKYKGPISELHDVVTSFLESFKSFRSIEVINCEAYIVSKTSETPRARKLFNVSIFLNWKLQNVRLSIKKAYEIVKEKIAKESERLKLIEEDYKLKDLKSIWGFAEKITCLYGQGKVYEWYRKRCYSAGQIYQYQPLEKKEVDALSMVSKSTTGTSNRMFFCLQLKDQYSKSEFGRIESQLCVASQNIQCLRVYHCHQTDQQQVCIIMKEDSPGESRQWFTVPRRKGFRVLQDLKVEVQRQYDCTSEEEFFKKESPSFVVYGDEEPFQQYQQILKQFKEPGKPQDKITTENLLEEFHQGLRKGKFRSIEDLREKYEEDWKALRKLSKEEKTLKDLVQQFVHSSYKKLPEKDRLVSLEEFVKKHPFTKEQKPLTDKYLKDVGLYEILKAVLDVIVIAKDSKLGTIVLHGAPNSGKSSIMEIIDEIFVCDYMLQTQGNFDIVPEFKPYKFQVVLSEETDFNKLLKDTHINNTKLFFERKGRPIEGKGKGAIWLYQGAANILASQYFPVHLLQTLNQEAINTRCVIVELKKSHSLSQKFPLSANQVAEWLLRSFQQETSEIEVEMSDEEADDELSEENGEVSATEELNQSFEMKPLPLKHPTMLGKRKRTQKTGLNSEKVVKRTKREIEWNQQDTLDKFAVPIEEEEKGLSPQERYETMKPQLQYYYRGKSFPYQLVHKIFRDGFREREFVYTQLKDDKEFWKRKVSFYKAEDLKELFTKETPYAIYSGAIFEQPVSSYLQLGSTAPVATDLAFDVDLDQYDHLRTCGCKGKSICDLCWIEFIVPAVQIIDKVIREGYNYKQLLWTFSGGRGVHLRVFDNEARRKDSQERELVLQAIKDEAERQSFEMKLDEGVTKDLKRVLRLPFSIHGSSGLLVVPFDPAEVSSFKVSEVPTYIQAANDFRRVDVYTNVLKKCFLGRFSNTTNYINSTFKSEDRNPYLTNNTQREGSQFQDIWELIKSNVNTCKSKLFWFQERTGLCQHKERFELMKYFKIMNVPQQRCYDFFSTTMPSDKFSDSSNKIPQLINWVYTVYKQ